MDYTSILAIDIASNKIDCCWFDSDNEYQYASVDYSQKNLESFLAAHQTLFSTHTLVGMESTGDYHIKAARFFLEKGFKVKILNPIITKEFNRATIRGRKTDKDDSFLIHKAIQEGHGDIVSLDQISNRHKEMLRLSHKLTKISSQLILKLQSTKRKGISDIEHIETRMEQIHKSIKQLAEDIVNEETGAPSNDEILIDSIPGFAKKLSAVVASEIGDIERFPSSKALVAYAGLDPRIKQSGKKLNTTGKLTKRGSAYLRSALFLGANVARRYDNDLATYYDKKKEEGRKHREVLCMISRKLLARIYVILKDQRPYVRKIST